MNSEPPSFKLGEKEGRIVMKNSLSLCLSRRIFGLVVVVIAFAGSAAAGGATVVDDAIWAHGNIYGTVVTPTSFNSPPLHSTDIIYSFSMSGLTGQRSVSEAAPGDRDYNGGRWNVKMVAFTALGLAVHDTDGDGAVDTEFTSAEEVLDAEVLGELEIFDTGFYFECPLRR
jgi:hypothetical protein